MALTDGIKNKLKVVANAIRSKTNKTEELTLEQMASEVSGIDTLQGLDFSEIYDQEQAKELNQYYKGGIEYAKEIKRNWTDIASTNGRYRYDSKLLYFPNVTHNAAKGFVNYFRESALSKIEDDYLDLPNVTSMTNWASYTSLRRIIINAPKLTNMQNIFGIMTLLEYAEILSTIENVTNITTAFQYCNNLITLKIKGWKQESIQLSNSQILSPESIKYIIWHSKNGNNNLGYEYEGATSRTLTLQKATTHDVTWVSIKNTTPSVEDCEMLGIDESEITKYGNLTWSQIASDVKLITITA